MFFRAIPRTQDAIHHEWKGLARGRRGRGGGHRRNENGKGLSGDSNPREGGRRKKEKGRKPKEGDI